MFVDQLTPQYAALTWQDALYLAPEWILALVWLIVIGLDLALPGRFGRGVLGWLILAGLAASAGLVLCRIFGMADVYAGDSRTAIRLLGDSFRIDQFSNTVKIIFLAAAALMVIWNLGLPGRKAGFGQGAPSHTLLPAVIGAMFIASSGDLITLYLGLEMMCITSYILASVHRRKTDASPGAFNYFVTGSISTAMILFGMSYLYGLTGTTNLGVMAKLLPLAGGQFQELLYIAFIMLISGMGLKMAAAPFHMWALDIYEQLSSPVTAFLAIVFKGAVFVMMFRIIYNLAIALSASENTLGSDIFLLLLVMAAAAMIFGTTAALHQRFLSRLMVWSAAANAGCLLVPIGLSFKGAHMANLGEFAFYLLVYMLMYIGMFAGLSIIQASAGHDQITGLDGLYYRAPWTAAALLILILSLAGLPVSGGFFGKLFILLGAAQSQTYWIVGVMASSTAISYYSYFSLIRHMFMRGSEEEKEVAVPLASAAVMWVCALAIFILGIMPGWLFGWLNRNVSFVIDLIIK